MEELTEGGDIGMFITLVPKVFIITFPYLLIQQSWGFLFVSLGLVFKRFNY